MFCQLVCVPGEQMPSGWVRNNHLKALARHQYMMVRVR